jgi:hypothetical protein
MPGGRGRRIDEGGVKVAARLLLGRTKWPSPSHPGDEIAQSEYRAHMLVGGGRQLDEGEVEVAGQVPPGKMEWPSPSRPGDQIVQSE